MLCCSLSFANKEARLSVLVRGARLGTCSLGLRRPTQTHVKTTPQIDNRVPSCKPCNEFLDVVISGDRFATDGRSYRPSPRRFSSGSYVRSDIPIQTSSIIPKKRSLRRFELSKEDEIARKPAFFSRIWRRRAERGPNQRGERTGRALYRRRGRSPRPTGGWMSARTLHSLRSLRFQGSGRILLAQQAQRGRRWNADPTGKTRNNLNRNSDAFSQTPKLPAAKATKCRGG